MDTTPPRVLMMFHGGRHFIGKDSTLVRLGVPLTVATLIGIKTIDCSEETEPTVVADLLKPLLPEVVEKMGKFDVITAEYPPFPVFKNDIFFENVVTLLASHGMFAMWPGLLTKSKYPRCPYKWLTPLSETADMRARTKFATDIVRRHPEFTGFKKKNKLLIFHKGSTE